MPEDYTPQIVSIDPTVTSDETRQTVPAYRIVFRVGKYNPPALIVSAKDFTAAHVRDLMNAVAAEIQKLPTSG